MGGEVGPYIYIWMCVVIKAWSKAWILLMSTDAIKHSWNIERAIYSGITCLEPTSTSFQVAKVFL